ncbi:15-hydroxyprostaglandin dehydrogenase [Trichonephila clavipes]|nr:15-hydroxyprostaglandin dehydrogenase [Trichonephila clavipes]
MTSAVLTDTTRALQETNRGSGAAIEESKNDVGSLEQLLLYADEHYLVGKLPLGHLLRKVLLGVEEYHQRNNSASTISGKEQGISCSNPPIYFEGKLFRGASSPVAEEMHSSIDMRSMPLELVQTDERIYDSYMAGIRRAGLIPPSSRG